MMHSLAGSVLRLVARAAPAVVPALRVLREPYSEELPAIVRVEKIPIARAHMPRGRDARAAAGDQLIAHELAVVFAKRPLERAESRIGAIRRCAPLPDVAPQLQQPAVVPVRRRSGGV